MQVLPQKKKEKKERQEDRDCILIKAINRFYFNPVKYPGVSTVYSFSVKENLCQSFSTFIHRQHKGLVKESSFFH